VEPKEFTFAQWLKYIFDHPDDDRDWHFHIDDDEQWRDTFNTPILTPNYVTRLFENITNATAPYSDAQIAHGLWFIASPNSDVLSCAVYENLDPLENQRILNLSYNLFEQLFAKRCTPHLSHLHRASTPTQVNPLNMTCYMWWDLGWITPQPGNLISEVSLSIMERTLGINSIACQESALHGLGHWKFKYPERVIRIIDQFLKRETDLYPDLKRYALNARTGVIQ
jgi:hypothetical protein